LKVHLELSLAFLYALLISTYLLDNFVVDVMTHNGLCMVSCVLKQLI
jgi:hypothetical protein